MIQDSSKNLDPFHEIIDLSLTHGHSFLKISSKSVNNLLRYFAYSHTDRYENMTSLAEAIKVENSVKDRGYM